MENCCNLSAEKTGDGGNETMEEKQITCTCSNFLKLSYNYTTRKNTNHISQGLF